jgi:hypothetical protein
MAQTLGFFNQWMYGEWADRAVINRNADELNYVENNVSDLQGQLRRQGQEIQRLRAMIMGLVEVMHAKAPFDDAELERATKDAWDKLQPPPQPRAPDDPWQQAAPVAAATTTDPYRGTPPPVRTSTCTKCGRTVPSTQTTITERGEVCDSCA